MPIAELLFITQWWFYLLVIGFGFLPLTAMLFDSYIDKGYIFAKVIGIAVISYLVFVIGITHLLPFTRIGTFAVVLVLFVLVYFFFIKSTAKFTLKNVVFFAIEEVFFFLAILFWAYIRTHNPDIHGLEKFMDFGFINSILRSDYFPPKDMWLTPEIVNYYYFGHFVTAILTKLSAIPSYISYNLTLATVFAICFTGSFSIAVNLLARAKNHSAFLYSKLGLAGILSALLVTMSGNLHTLYAFFKAYPLDKPVPIWQLQFQPLQFPNSYWYPNATRYIYNTIHEFPMYSWVVADLHGHVLDIIFVITTIGLLLAFFLKTGEKNVTTHTAKNVSSLLRFSYWKSHFLHLTAISFLLAIMYMTNAWDGMIYFLLAGLVLFTISLLQVSGRTVAEKLFQGILGTIVPVMTLGIGFILVSLPFSLFFKPFVSGIGVICAPEILTNIEQFGPLLFEKEHCQRSPFWQLVMLYGFFYFFIVSFVVFLSRAKELLRTDIFVLLLIIIATILINVPEFLYVKDIYPDHYRANTMFKLVFQSFIMLSLASGYILIRFLGFFREKHIALPLKIILGLWMIPAWLLLVVVFTYPFLATNSYYGDLKTRKDLNGIKYLQILHPEDFEAITWLNRTIDGQPVILEAQGDSYTDYARISSNTGLPTVLGWTVHEWLWRGSYDVPSPRIGEIETLYESTDMNATKSLLRKYNIEYVYIGDLEREKYESINEMKWEDLGDIVFQNNATMIYRINKNVL